MSEKQSEYRLRDHANPKDSRIQAISRPLRYEDWDKVRAMLRSLGDGSSKVADLGIMLAAKIDEFGDRERNLVNYEKAISAVCPEKDQRRTDFEDVARGIYDVVALESLQLRVSDVEHSGEAIDGSQIGDRDIVRN